MTNGLERAGLWGLGLLTLARILLGAFTELSPDEAYYLLWAQRLDWSYYSKGPGIALVLKFSTSLFGETQFGIRVLSPLLGLATSLLVWELGKRTVGRSAAFWAVAAFNLTPIFNAGSILMTIDPVMMCCWMAALFTFWRALEDESRQAWRWWLLSGAALGFGFLCKYTILVVFLTMIVYLAVSRNHRAQFRGAGFWIMTAIMLLSMAPVAIWNSQNEWITVRHLLERTGILLKEEPVTSSGGFPIRVDDFLAYLGMHFGVYSPLLFAGLLATLWKCLRHFRRHEGEYFLAIFSVPLVLFYLLLSLGDTGEVNWTAPGFLGLGLLAVRYWEEWEWKSGRKKRRWATLALITSMLMSLWAVNPDTPRLVGLSWPYQRDPFLRLRGWESAAEELERFVAEMTKEDGKPPFVLANRYQTAATLGFYGRELEVLRPHPSYPVVNGRIFEGGKIKNQFPFWPSYLLPRNDEERNEFLGRNAVYISDDVRFDRPHVDVNDLFQNCELKQSFEVVRRGRMVRRWKIFACYGYKGGDGSEQGGR